ncbi:MAG: nicotinate-nucleotide adenylyltransferase [Flavobacteriaceae bacterium]|nr:nicotinate-nucleotide adenylyltransferase [Flavobacteriaceae bacterium]|tara:strand:+ start:4898 stop:6364 length:1467 start_codon:yes stop_codon:yes gene_type:complete
MSIQLSGDRPFENRPSIEAKALRVNLNEHIYGTFAEIGAGQEVARHFFRVGGASGTIAKTISAYDKSFSDNIYGEEDDGRYVTEPRLRKMLDHEIHLLEHRISRKDHPKKLFFTLANTVATIDYAKKFKGHGWMGIRFQLDPKQEFSEISLHVRFHHQEARLQQEVLGLMGVNLVYGAFYKHDEPKKLLRYLYDHIDNDGLNAGFLPVEIDTINFSGPVFKDVDNRLISLELVKLGMTDAVMFDASGNNVLPARILYKKNILTLRGSFRPVTNVNIDMFKKSYEIFIKEPNVDEEKTEVIFEITLSNLMSEGEIDEKDFMDRAMLLCSLGHTVMISNFKEYYKLVDYFSNYTKSQLALTIGVNSFIEIFNEDYYDDLSGGILEAFGKMFYNNLKVYLYPIKNKEGKVINSNNLKLHPRMKEFYKFFKYNGKVVDIFDFEEKFLSIFSRDILKKIKNHKSGWEKQLPDGISDMILKNKMFGYLPENDRK